MVGNGDARSAQVVRALQAGCQSRYGMSFDVSYNADIDRLGGIDDERVIRRFILRRQSHTE